MEGLYKINLISSDLSTEETILQIANSLDNLNGVVDDIFSRIMKRVNRNVEKTSDIKKRIEACNDKVTQVSGSANAIKVFSSAKYPANVRHEHYRSLLDSGAYRHEPTPVTLSRTSPRAADKAVNVSAVFVFFLSLELCMHAKPTDDSHHRVINQSINQVRVRRLQA